MATRNFDSKKAGSQEQNEPRLYPHTELNVDLKLLTHQRGRMPVGANLNGCIRRDGEEHYTFTEAQFGSAARRNPHVFEGRHITITRRSDGSLHPNFKEMHIGAGFRIDSYALAVMNELRYGLKGLVEE